MQRRSRLPPRRPPPNHDDAVVPRARWRRPSSSPLPAARARRRGGKRRPLAAVCCRLHAVAQWWLRAAQKKTNLAQTDHVGHENAPADFFLCTACARAPGAAQPALRAGVHCARPNTQLGEGEKGRARGGEPPRGLTSSGSWESSRIPSATSLMWALILATLSSCSASRFCMSSPLRLADRGGQGSAPARGRRGRGCGSAHRAPCPRRRLRLRPRELGKEPEADVDEDERGVWRLGLRCGGAWRSGRGAVASIDAGADGER